MRRCFDPWDLDIVKVIGFLIGAVLGKKSIDISMTGVVMAMLVMRRRKSRRRKMMTRRRRRG